MSDIITTYMPRFFPTAVADAYMIFVYAGTSLLARTTTTSISMTRMQRQTLSYKLTSQPSKLRKLEVKRIKGSIQRVAQKEQMGSRRLLMWIISILTRRYYMLHGIRKKIQSRLQLRTTFSCLQSRARVRREHPQTPLLALHEY